MMDVADIIQLVTQVYSEAIPFALIFWIGELIVTTFCRAAFSGRLSFRIQ